MGKGDNKIKWGDFLALAILNANQLYLQKRILKTLSLWPRSNISHISVYTSQFFLYLIHKTMRWKKLTKWLFNPTQDGPSLCCSRVRRGLKDTAPGNLSYISANNETWHSYILHKGDPKIHPLNSVLLVSEIFHPKSEIFVISRNTDTDWILIHNSYFFKLFLSFLF